MKTVLLLMAGIISARLFAWGPYTRQGDGLLVPDEAMTSSSAAILWSRPQGENAADSFVVELDGKTVARVKVTDWTINGLEADREYFVRVTGYRNGKRVCVCGESRIRTKPCTKIYDVVDYGARGDGKTLNTEAFARAIAACTPGGTVRVPRGVFLTGAIKLKSNMTLLLDDGCRIVGSTNLVDYPVATYRAEGRELPRYASLIGNDFADERLHDIAIVGLGTIDASGRPLRQARDRNGRIPFPGSAICMRNVDRLYLQNITVRHSPFWCVHLVYCENVSVNGVKVHSKLDEQGRKYRVCNGDGINPDSCRHVAIFNTYIASQDDSIAIKSGRDEEGRKVAIPCEDIRISNMRIASGGGVAIGSELSGGVRDVLVQDCELSDDVYSVTTIKCVRPRGGFAENLRFENINHRYATGEYHDWLWCRGAINIDQYYSDENPDMTRRRKVDEGTTRFKNISFENVSIDTVGGNAIYIAGRPESPIENVSFKNVKAIGRTGLVVHNVKGLDASGLVTEDRK